ncbi:MAG: hypothetical protein AB1715_06860, partial [Acidobacteriota bacterium]
KRNLWPLTWDLDSSDYPVQRFRIFHEAKKPENLIVDLKIREGRLARRDYLHIPESFFEYEFLILEWLTLQNPRLGFSAKRPPLPGQDHPGLGLGKKVVDVFIYLARLARKAGIVAFPAYFHNALLFCRYFRFLNPEKYAEVLAIQKAFPKVPFKHLTWIIYLNCLRQNEGKVYEWKAEEQVYPLNKVLRDYLDSKVYNRRLKQSLEKWRFTIDWNCYEKKLEALIGGKAQN